MNSIKSRCIIKNLVEVIINFFKNAKKSTLISYSIMFLFILTIFIVILWNFRNFSIEVKDVKTIFDKGISKLEDEINSIQFYVEKGSGYHISLKEDAFSIIDDTEIILGDGLNNHEIEEALDNHKYSYKTTIDGDLSDQQDNAIKFNYLWGIEKGCEQDIHNFIDDEFTHRLGYIHNQHIYRIDWQYFNQRSVPKIGNVICVPTSAIFLLNALGCKATINDILNFFCNNKQIDEYARKHFGKWIEAYIEDNKLYQITGTFTYGLNLFLEKYYSNFPYILDFDYWNINEISDYVEVFGLMSATFFPNWVLRGERTGGHMIVVSKVYRDFENNVIAFGINDPFGNPNVKYNGIRGLDGKNVVISLDEMLKVMKSYNDDHSKGSKYLYRVLYFRNKE